MKLINALLSNASFLEWIESFNNAINEYQEYSLLLQYLKFRYCDAYDMSLFQKNLSQEDIDNNTPIYQRFKIEHKAYINRFYGPFFTGNDNDDLSIINKMSCKEILKYILKSSSLSNDKLSDLLQKSNCDNIYDFYKSLYLQKSVNPSVKEEQIGVPCEEDEEYILWNYTNLRHEQDGRATISIPNTAKELWKDLIEQYKISEIKNEDEPNDLIDIISSSNFENKRYSYSNYEEKLKGASIGRFAGCMLGAPVENWSIEKMVDFADKTKTPFPPTNYWNDVLDKENLHYKTDKKYLFSKNKMKCVVADDDVTYTVLNSIILSKYGKDFSIKQLTSFWKDHVPYACTAEYSTMIGLRKDYSIEKITNSNPFVELIGAAIRADAFGYVCPGNPYLAASLAYKDACISHKRNGIYGEMFLAATIAASFSVDDPLEAIRIGMNYIPTKSRLYKDILWALSLNGKVKDYNHANSLIKERFQFMNKVHTNNNMCAIVFSFVLGGKNFDNVISNCIAMGYDNDCTGASVGSILGAIISIKNIDEKWYKNFNNTIHTYIRGYESITINQLIEMIKEARN